METTQKAAAWMRETLHPAYPPQSRQAHKCLNLWNTASAPAFTATPSVANASLIALAVYANGVRRTARQTEHAATASAVLAMTSTSEQMTMTKGHGAVFDTVSSCAGLQLELSHDTTLRTTLHNRVSRGREGLLCGAACVIE